MNGWINGHKDGLLSDAGNTRWRQVEIDGQKENWALGLMDVMNKGGMEETM